MVYLLVVEMSGPHQGCQMRRWSNNGIGVDGSDAVFTMTESEAGARFVELRLHPNGRVDNHSRQRSL
ncbi:hypothetical protein A8M60_03915 [Nocardia farcinica]|nr:hypothetical protein A8M60_03915 [Nocardia farcinica]